MKKFFTYVAAGLMLASCSNDDFSGVKGSEEDVKISIELPSAISSRATATGNSAQGGVTNMPDEAVTFTAALYHGDTKVWEGVEETDGATHSVTFTPRLVIGETYRLVSYAQFGTEADAVADLSAQKEAFGINDETQDAYYLDTEMVAEPQMSGTLTRHTGKLRLIALDYGWAMNQMGDKTIKSIKVTYEDGRYTTFDSHTGLWSEVDAAATTYTAPAIDYAVEDYANQAIGPDDVKAVKTIFVDYIPVNVNNDEYVSIVVDVEYNEGGSYNREINLDIPIRRNYVTTLVGSFFTSQMDLSLVIDPIFENELVEEIPELIDKDHIDNAEDFIKAMAQGGDITVTGSFTLGEGQKAVCKRTANVTLKENSIITIADSKTGGILNEGDLTIYQNRDNNKTGIVCENKAEANQCIVNTGKLVLDGVYLTTKWNQSGAAVYNKGGELVLRDNPGSDVHIFASFYAIYNEGGKISVSNIYGDLHHYIVGTSTSLNGQWAYAIRNLAGGEADLKRLDIKAVHGAVACNENSSVTLGDNVRVKVAESAAGAGDSYYAVYCTGEGAVVNVNGGTYTTVRDAFYAENGGVINIASGVKVNGEEIEGDESVGGTNPPIPEPTLKYIYLIGTGVEGISSWIAQDGLKLSNENYGFGDIYGAEITFNEPNGYGYFMLSTKLAEESYDTDVNQLREYRFYPQTNDFLLSEDVEYEMYNYSYSLENNAWKIANGTYEIIVDTSNMKIKVSK